MDMHTRARNSLSKREIADILARIKTRYFKGNKIRVITNEDQEWLVFADICKALGYRNPAHECKRLGPDEKCKLDIGLKNTLAVCINQEGLYSFLVFSSKKEVAEFWGWASAEIFEKRNGGACDGSVGARSYSE